MKTLWKPYPPVLLLAGSVILCFIAAVIGSLVTPAGPGSWFMTELIKPEWQPPNYLFGPVWTILYLLMGLALAWILAEGWQKKEVWTAALVFLIQLVLNVLWSWLFFGVHNLAWATGEILDLWVAICATIYLFYRIKPFAAYLLVPYILWVSFASFLCATIWMLNP